MIRDESVAIVPAAGRGERLGLGPKAFLELDGRTLLERVVDVLAPCVRRVVVAVPAQEVRAAQARVGALAEVIAGAGTRQATVALLFGATSEQYILVHDVTRPFASRALARRVLAAAVDYGAAAAMVHPAIPVGVVRDGAIERDYDRTEVMLPQSPQAFQRVVLERALAHAAAAGIERQTTWQLVRAAGISVMAVPGEETNVKITTARDWDTARNVLWPALRERES